MMNHPHPANYNIPHDHWRVGQYEAFQNILKSNRQFIIASAPVGSGKCLDVNTIVSTPYGNKRIGDINKGDLVSSMLNHKISIDVVNHVYETKARECLEIVSNYGYSIKCTPDHAIRIFNNDELSWKKAGNLTTDDYICIAKGCGFDEPRSSDLFFDKISRIEYAGVLETVDISVLVNHNFIANGIVVHNSAIGAALGSYGRSVRVLTHTRQLQDQYRKYHFDVLYGMSAYPCALNSIFQADMCAYMEKMTDCPVSGSCQYLLQREFVKKSDRQSLSYAYAMLATWIESNSVDYVYQDEAHLIPDIVMAHMTIEISHKDCKKLQIDPYPLAKMDSQNARRIRVTGWALDSLDKMLAEIIHLSKLLDKTPYDVRKLKLYKQFYDPLLNAINACSDMPDQFWIKSDEESLKIVPLTAAPFYKKMMAKGGERFVLTSATIGNPRTFSSALGIKSNEYDWVNTPSNFGPDEMPVYVYNNAPKMRYGMSDSERKEQVRLIEKIIGERNPTWNTLIQTSSIRDANWIANELARKFGDRIYVPSLKTTTSQKIEDWRMQIARKPGTITLAWSFHAGVDAPEANINIIQKVPFAPLDEPGKALLDVNPKFYKWRAANQVEQACGRVRRGEIAHYEQIGEPERKHVAILDMNIEQVKSQTSDHFVRCLNYI